MIYNLKDLLHYESSCGNILSATKYPKQDTDKIGKIVKMATMIEPDNSYNARYYDDKGIWTTNPECRYYLILRYDLEEPYRVIAISDRCHVIVSSTQNVDNFYIPPTDPIDPVKPSEIKRFQDYEPLRIENRAGSQAAFGKIIEREEVCYYGIQSSEYLGRMVYTEYPIDIPSLPKEKEFPASVELSNDELRKSLEKLKASYGQFPDFMLRQFKYYSNRFAHSKLNIPRRPVNMGVVIRADTNPGCNGYIVVVEYREDGIAFVTNYDTNLYIDNEYSPNEPFKLEMIFDILKDQTICTGIIL